MLEMEGVAPEVRAAAPSPLPRSSPALGAEVGEVDLAAAQYGLPPTTSSAPPRRRSNLARFDGIRYGHRVADAEDVLDLYMRSRAEGFGPESIRRIMLGTYALSAGYYDAYYGQAQKARTVIASDFDGRSPTTTCCSRRPRRTTAFKIGEKAADPLSMYLSDIYTIPVNLAGNCRHQRALRFRRARRRSCRSALQLIGDSLRRGDGVPGGGGHRA